MITEILYLIAAVLFILGIKLMTKVKSARNGNLISSAGMLIAVVATVYRMYAGDGVPAGVGWSYIIAGLAIGGIIGVLLAYKIKMTEMPQMVALLNGFGGGASVLVALSYLWLNRSGITSFDMVTVILSVLIGAVTFSGSMVAFGKLQGLIKSRPILFKGHNALNAFLLVIIFLASAYIFFPNAGNSAYLILAIAAVSLILGILLVTPIGGADMPVVISLLNSYSGLAACATGFVLKNSLLIISGSLVGASGIILSNVMCKAMNRSLTNVLFGGFGAVEESKEDAEYKNIKECSPEEAAIILENADSVIMVPGYGLAVSQAQYALQELSESLEKKGKRVSYAIHPVAGRMPGHMNVLLAEANVPYDKIFSLDQINHEFKNTDVVIVVGANDVVNPAAEKEKGSPIYGMPILKAYEARTVIFVKRSLGAGFSGIKNAIFENDNTLMLFADAKKAILSIKTELEEG